MLGLQYSSTSQKLYFMAYAMYSARLWKPKHISFKSCFRFFLLCSWPLRFFPSLLAYTLTTDQVNLAFINIENPFHNTWLTCWTGAGLARNNNLYCERSEARVANCNLWHLMKTSCHEIFHTGIIKETSASFIKHTNCEIWMMVKVPWSSFNYQQ